MNALALALVLASGPPDVEEARLPRSLSESYVVPVAASVKEDHEILVGLHAGVADGVDSKSTVMAGFEWRIHILPWLGAGGSVDFHNKEATEIPGADIFQIPFMWCVLLYPPVDLGPFRPYGLAGFGFTLTDVSGPAVRNTTDINLLGFVGVGLEFELSSNVMLDANARFIWAKDPPGSGGFSADWAQVTVGLLVKLPM